MTIDDQEKFFAALRYLIELASEKETKVLKMQQRNVKNKVGELENWEITVIKI